MRVVLCGFVENVIIKLFNCINNKSMFLYQNTFSNDNLTVSILEDHLISKFTLCDIIMPSQLHNLSQISKFFGPSSYGGSYKILIVCLFVHPSVCPSISSAFFLGVVH